MERRTRFPCVKTRAPRAYPDQCARVTCVCTSNLRAHAARRLVCEAVLKPTIFPQLVRQMGSYCVIGIILSFIALYNDVCLHSRLRKGREKENSTASSPRASRLRSNSLRPGSTATQAIILESLFLFDSGRTIVSTDMAPG